MTTKNYQPIFILALKVLNFGDSRITNFLKNSSILLSQIMKSIFKLFFQIFKIFMTYLGISLTIIFILYTIYAIPAMISLPSGIRPGLSELSIREATDLLDDTNLEGLDLIEEARLLVKERMVYCRRNSYDSYHKAFIRGYGFCQQQAFALANKIS